LANYWYHMTVAYFVSSSIALPYIVYTYMAVDSLPAILIADNLLSATFEISLCASSEQSCKQEHHMYKPFFIISHVWCLPIHVRRLTSSYHRVF